MPEEHTVVPVEVGPAVAVLGVSAVACLGLLALVYAGGGEPGTGPDWVADLPLLNAGLNAASALAIVTGFRAVRRGDLAAHRRAMLTAFGLSAVFLVSYVTYHALAGDTPFVGSDAVRAAYLVVLVTHVLSSVVVLPLVLGALACAFTGRFALHRRLARFTVPIWLYVSVTGVVVVVALRTVGS